MGLALATAAVRRIGDFNVQEFADILWAFAMANELAPVLLDPIHLLDGGDVPVATPLRMQYYQMSMQSLAIGGQIVSGLVLLSRTEAAGLLCHSDPGSCYEIVRMLLEAC